MRVGGGGGLDVLRRWSTTLPCVAYGVHRPATATTPTATATATATARFIPSVLNDDELRDGRARAAALHLVASRSECCHVVGAHFPRRGRVGGVAEAVLVLGERGVGHQLVVPARGVHGLERRHPFRNDVQEHLDEVYHACHEMK